ncbi:nucleotide exchange factor GrpE [Candidatus Kuenenbacteria bacterium HGW-Kuenenbacteria-1]|uniref:Protein GrpE n=1 Tax=Candidatus Kuenenbacteria bacterium HGW-Kuenenbacteria-1 TaxID=2013812 RepID=A0A2N1UN95_9BACT|nr:MAG: nucleotide exchange factor GrpE [Candidatus Kuenenbacteria bacterium HGW-Kuenenbacteria-1]
MEQKQEKTEQELEEELEKYKKQAEEYLAGWQRAKADFINFKRQNENEKENWAKFSNLNLILQLLPVLDNLQSANNQQPKIDNEQTKKWIEGICHIQRQFEDVLKDLGLEKIKTIKEKFDPEIHESVGKEETQKIESQIIKKEMQTGYKMYGKIIRVAKVIIGE